MLAVKAQAAATLSVRNSARTFLFEIIKQHRASVRYCRSISIPFGLVKDCILPGKLNKASEVLGLILNWHGRKTTQPAWEKLFRVCQVYAGGWELTSFVESWKKIGAGEKTCVFLVP